MPDIRVERSFSAPPPVVFAWLENAHNYTAARLCLWEKRSVDGMDAPYGEGAVRLVLGAGAWFKEQITAYESPRYFEYLMIGSVPRFDHRGGRVLVEADGEGSKVTWTTSYSVPWWSGGVAFERFTATLLRASFKGILDACAKATGTVGSSR
jgi:hypothetical protein